MHDDIQCHDPSEDDPLGLRGLPQLTPETDGWPAIRAALADGRAPTGRPRHGRRAPLAWLAAAACLVIVVGVLSSHDVPRSPAGATHAEGPALTSADTGTSASATSVEDLVSLSQLLERRLWGLRARTGSMPADAAIYVAELEDLIARVDSELSDRPLAPALWRQRVNLLLDLELLFQHQFEREYGRMASL